VIGGFIDFGDEMPYQPLHLRLWQQVDPLPPESEEQRQAIEDLLEQWPDFLGPELIRDDLNQQGVHLDVPLGVIVGVRNDKTYRGAEEEVDALWQEHLEAFGDAECIACGGVAADHEVVVDLSGRYSIACVAGANPQEEEY
jgi:hypothetical protein